MKRTRMYMTASCHNSSVFLKRGMVGDVMVLGKLSMPGRPANLDKSRLKAYCACSNCGWRLFVFGHFFFLSSVYSSLFLSP